jgi:VCBS repeat protein/ASPIC/UnbV protein
VALLAVALSAGAQTAVAPGTQEMAALLAERAQQVDPTALTLLVNDRRADLLARQLAQPLPPAERMRLRGLAAVELINAGRNDDALKALAVLAEEARAQDPEGWREYESGARLLEAMAWLRVGEEQNCHLAQNRDSCLAPLAGGGIHRQRQGGARAVQVLEDLLAREPENLRARWLLNIAHMTLGSYPAGVPERQRIPEAAFASEQPFPRFDNVAAEVGLPIHALAGGAILEDFDGDGWLDVMVSSMGLQDPLRLFRNHGNGSFQERTAEAGLTGEAGGLNLLQADYDNDGDADVVVLRGGWLGSQGRFPLSLLRNEGRGTFADVTRAAGLLRFAPSQTAAWLDYDGDGWLDLYVGNESTPGDDHPCQLFRNRGDGTFEDRAAEASVAFVGYVKAVAAGDYDNDGRPDLYLSVWGGDNLLFHNDGPVGPARRWRFTDAAATAGVREPRDSFPAFFFDYDDDGWLDLFVAGYGTGARGFPLAEHVAADYLGLPSPAERGRLYRNRGDGTFADVTRAAGLQRVVPAMGLNFGDLDNDGWLDFYAGTGTPDLAMLVPNRMFRNDGGRVFRDVTTAGGFGHLQKGHGVAFGDVDNDGDQDVFEEMGGAYSSDQAWSALYRNPGNANAWLGLELQGARTNRRAVGARMTVTVDGPSGRRRLHRTVGSGGSFGASPLRQEIGLGDARRIESVEVFWPVTGRTQTVTGVSPRRRYLIREDRPEAAEIQRPGAGLSPGGW